MEAALTTVVKGWVWRLPLHTWGIKRGSWQWLTIHKRGNEPQLHVVFALSHPDPILGLAVESEPISWTSGDALRIEADGTFP
jgi:hypothetical protein